jgi:predicted RecA/RadA family phage recombinase
MATNVKYGSTDILNYVAPSAATTGTPILIGGVLVVPLESADTGATFAAQVRGRVYIGKTSAQAWTQGDQIYWNAGTSLTTNVQTGLLRAVGIAGEAAANPSSYGYVDLGVGVEADSDVGTLKADLASTATGKGTALIGDEVSGGTLKAKLDTCTTQAAAAAGAGTIPAYAGASRVLTDSLVVAANLPQMAAAGGAGELLYTAAADRAVAKAGITKANLTKVGVGVTVTAGAEVVNERQLTIAVTGPDGAAVTGKQWVMLYTSATDQGAGAAILDTGISAVSTGTLVADMTATAGFGVLLTDATGALVCKLKHAAGALTCYAMATCVHGIGSVNCDFAA